MSNGTPAPKQYHSFVDYMEDEGRDESAPPYKGHNTSPPNIPGIIVPQQVYVHPNDAGEPPSLENMRRLTFFVNGSVGLCLQEALQSERIALDNGAMIPAAHEGPRGSRASLRILWPGYDSWSRLNSLSFCGYAQNAPPRTLNEIAHQVVKLIQDFWTSMQEAPGGIPEWDLQIIPFDQLYLIELRNVSPGTWQPVITRVMN